MNKLEKLKKHFDSRSVNKTKFESDVRKNYPTFSRQKLNAILRGDAKLTDKAWEEINSVLKWD
jgi:hypothetical protein